MAKISFTAAEASGAMLSNRGNSSRATSSQLPITRVKNIIKSDPDITLASQEATLVISKVIEFSVI